MLRRSGSFPWIQRLIHIGILGFVLPWIPSYGEESTILFPRYPAVSPDGDTLAFTYEGDLWSVAVAGGEAKRLTVHPAYDRRPRWSPDGSRLAFASNRHGADDVYVMPATGGTPRRLTFWSGGDSPADWLSDDELLIHSSRGITWNRSQRLYRIRTDAVVEPRLLTRAAGVGGQISPDGKRMLFVREGVSWTRKRYRGPQSAQIWLHDLESGRFTALRSGPERHTWPLWAPNGREFYYVKEIDGTDQLCRGRIDSEKDEPLTDFVDDGVRYPTISRNGRTIAFEQGFAIWTLDVESGRSAPVAIRIATDRAVDDIVTHTVTSATEAAPSPDGKQIAFAARGEIWVRRAKDGLVPNRITDHPARDGSPTWLPDGKGLLFVSDRSGRRNLYVARSADEDEPRLDRCLTVEVQLLPGPGEERSRPAYSPDGKWLAYVEGSGELRVMEAAGGPGKLLFASWDTPYFSWSPDSRWLAYSVQDNDFNRDIWLVPADGSATPRNLTVHPATDGSPAWSPDGKKLAFISDRLGNNRELWWVWLAREDEDRTAEDRELLDDPPPVTDDEKKKDTKQKDKDDVTPVVIDFENIHRRFRRAFSSNGRESAPVWSPDSKTVAFVSNYEGQDALYKMALPGDSSPGKITGGSGSPSVWLQKNKRIYRISRGVPQSHTASGKTERYGFRVKHRVDRHADLAQVFDEAWRTMDRSYYDPEHGGVDWQQKGDLYRPVATTRVSRREFQDLINMLLGELNGSHLGFTASGKYAPPESPRTGVLGLEFDDSDGGDGLRINHVLRGGPCDKKGIELVAGDRLLAIDGTPLDATTNRSRLLADKVGRRVALTVHRAGADEPTEVVVRPFTSRARTGLLYEEWLRRSRETVSARSGGRLGYVHIRSMNVPSLERFEAELYSIAEGKDGLLIDVRNNGGGWTTDYLLAMLTRKPHALTVPRGGGAGYPIGRLVAPSWTKPIAVLCNQNSFSNAEIFAHSIKTLQRGKLIGNTTAGGVISTGRRTLLDGSSIRTPFRGWYLFDDGRDMELNGAVPDYPVPFLPEDEVAGRDPQLSRAIEVLLEEIPRGRRRAF